MARRGGRGRWRGEGRGAGSRHHHPLHSRPARDALCHNVPNMEEWRERAEGSKKRRGIRERRWRRSAPPHTPSPPARPRLRHLEPSTCYHLTLWSSGRAIRVTGLERTRVGRDERWLLRRRHSRPAVHHYANKDAGTRARGPAPARVRLRRCEVGKRVEIMLQ